MRRLLVLAVLLATETAEAAFERMGVGASSTGMGGALTGVPGHEWSAFFNPAGFSLLAERMLSVSYVPQPFGLNELAHGAFSFAEPAQVGTFAVSGNRLGFELYREVTLTGSFSTTPSDGFHAGINVNYFSLSIAGYGTAGVLGLDAGVLVELTGDVSWGARASNINSPTIGEAKERLPQVFAAGVSYKPLHEATLAVDFVKDIRYPVEVRMGLEYRLLDIVHLRAGSVTEPSSLHAGVGVAYQFLQLDYAITDHPDLGMTHQFSVSIRLGDL